MSKVKEREKAVEIAAEIFECEPGQVTQRQLDFVLMLVCGCEI